ncbi:pentatricopeptide repeat-containing protein At2g13600 [Cryptomeria japonica]|uniref:pentatricopeptide repeat-containing protein At2g13600 n=1 Tax=Cryptomeria japonica TaxID=3369 RepID=UPI0027DA032C|nr:pentatricopeptide repeat-containing protein At2g13600 [Cryptomeria japonica]
MIHGYKINGFNQCGRNRIAKNKSSIFNHSHTMPSTIHLKRSLNFQELGREFRLNAVLHIVATPHKITVDSRTQVQSLHTYVYENVLSQGQQIHSVISHRGFAVVKPTFFQNNLISMYAKCGGLNGVRKVFDEMTEQDGFSWNVMISAYRRHGCAHEALTLFHQMQPSCTQPDQFTFSSILPVCAEIRALAQGVDIHRSVIERGYLSDVVVASALIDMYAKCGSIQKARELFDKMPQKNVVSWNSMIAGYVQNGDLDEALRFFKEIPERNVVSWNAMIAGYAQNGIVEKALTLFYQMQQTGVQPDQFTFASILPACAKIGAMEQGMHIHQNIVESGLLSDVVVASALIDMYAKCGNTQKARGLFEKIPKRNVVSWNVMIAGYVQNGVLHEAVRLFKEMPRRDVVSWNTMIAGYAQSGLVEKAMETFKKMQLTGVTPNSITFTSILTACAAMRDLEKAMDIHKSIIESGFFLDAVVASGLIDMYAKCGNIQKARELFDKLSQRDVVSWNAMIAGYTQNGILGDALSLFKQMPGRDVVSWNVIIAGYAQNGLVEKALETFKQIEFAGVKSNSTTFASILPVCTKVGALRNGMDIHQRIIKNGFLSDVVLVSTLTDMYAKCGSIHEARELFEKIPLRDAISWNAMITGYAQNGALDEALRLFKQMPQRDAVSWTAMVSGYAQNGLGEKALETFKEMQLVGIQPDQFTFASILPTCAKMGALEQGIEIHQSTIESGFLSDVVVVSALVDMYAKCGSIQKARKLFDNMNQRDAVSWNAIIAGYAFHGFHMDAFQLFELMKLSGACPDRISFICVLFACSHAGLVDEGCKYFNDMINSHCFIPTIDHYVCIVDLVGRVGYLEEALNFIIKMPVKPVAVVWICMLGACRSHNNVGLGVFAATCLFEMDPKSAAPYVLLSNIYAEGGRWIEVQKVRRLMKDRGIKKTPGCSWIEIHKIVHVFFVESGSHPQTHEIYGKLDKLST